MFVLNHKTATRSALILGSVFGAFGSILKLMKRGKIEKKRYQAVVSEARAVPGGGFRGSGGTRRWFQKLRRYQVMVSEAQAVPGGGFGGSSGTKRRSHSDGNDH